MRKDTERVLVDGTAAPVSVPSQVPSPVAVRVPVAHAGEAAGPPVVQRPPPASPSVAVAAAAKPRALQPWEDELVSPDVAPSNSHVPSSPQSPPPGQVLSVRESARPMANSDTDDGGRPDSPEDYLPNGPLALVEPVQAATKIVAIPVRTHAESRSDVTAQQTPHALVPTEEGDFWHATVQQLIKLETINAMVRELALQSQLVARDTDQWILRVERESLNQAGSRDRLTAALKTAGHDVKLVVEIGRVNDCPARRNMVASEEKQLAAEKIIFDDPFVQSMMRDFGAKIVPGSIKPL